MDTIKSFKGYGKVDPAEEAAFRKKTRKRIIIVIVSAVLLIGIVIGIVAGTVIHKNNKSDNESAEPEPRSAADYVKAVCSVTEYKDSCFSSLSQVAADGKITDPKKLFAISLKSASNSLAKLSSRPQEWIKGVDDKKIQKAFDVCQDVFSDALDHLNDTISSVGDADDDKLFSSSRIADLKTLLSSAITDQETCLDALDEMKANDSIIDNVKSAMKNSTEFTSNSLAIVAKILGIVEFKFHRKLLSISSEFPEWVKSGDRRLLQLSNPKPDVVVDKKGSPGSVKTIQEAVDRIPKKSVKRFVIYVMAGEYIENLLLDKSKWNVMMYGDGKGVTIISGSTNFIDGTPTFHTATFAVAGKGFIARDMTFKNTAGAEKHQAVAMRSGSDESVFYRCSFEGHQDTLYAHSNRQFYRDCDITGTIDFIFGNAAVVFQSCKIQPRQPMPNQFVTITAQGKKDPNQNTGISIQKCDIFPLDNLVAHTYLGRPWKAYSTTVVMQSSIGAFLRPKGWIEWVANVEPPSSIFYAEYMNSGAGSGVEQRVKWAGYKSSLTADEASKFTVKAFIQGKDWLPSDVTYIEAL